MTQDPQHEIFARLAALYALGGLEGSERRSFEQHLETCRPCVDEVSSFLPVTQALVFTAPAQTPPARLRERIVGPAGSVSPESTTPTPAPSRQPAPAPSAAEPVAEPVAAPLRAPSGPRRMSVWQKGVAFACLIIAGGLGWYAAQQVNLATDLRAELEDATLRERVASLDAAASRRLAEEMRGRAGALAALDVTSVELEGQPGAENAFGRAFLSMSRGVVIAALNMPPLPPGQAYQVWFVLPDDPVSAGFARVDEAGRLFESLDSAPDTAQLIAVAVTMEPEGGVQVPSGNVLLLGRAAQ